MNEIIIGSFLERADVVEAAAGVQPNKKQKKKHTGKKEKPAPKSKDIRDLFRNNVQINQALLLLIKLKTVFSLC